MLGCGTYRYNIKVNGYTDPNAPSLLKPGGSFVVMENQEAKNPLLEAEIKEKVRETLKLVGLLKKALKTTI